MTYSVTYNPLEGIIEACVWGNTGLAELKEMVQEIAPTVKETGCFFILTDLRAAQISLSTLDLYYLPGAISEIMSGSNVKTYSVKRAFVISEKMKFFHFYEDVSLNRGHLIKLFYDIDAARKWLKHK